MEYMLGIWLGTYFFELIMPQKKHKTKYPGVFNILGLSSVSKKAEKFHYIINRKLRKLVEEKAGRQFQDNMSPARASMI
ncbi:hypothetical protein ACFL50_04650 [Candidatus Latescibacterota bacterium]